MYSSITINCRKENLKSIRNFISTKLKEASISESEVNLIVLAVDEICSNIIIHSNKCDESKKIELEINYLAASSTLEINLSDRGDFFDYNSYTEPSIQSIKEEQVKGSLGLMLVRRIMDQIEFKKFDNRNICTMVKKIQHNLLATSL